jgi:multidrug resistance efflux pump
VAAPFSHTLRALAGDRLRPSALALTAGGVLLAAWSGWFFLADVAVVETTRLARLEVAQDAHPVEAAVGGRVISSKLELGREVQAGEVLVELDATGQELTLAVERAKIDAYTHELAALNAELAAGSSTERTLETSTRASQAEVSTRFREADAAARLADEELSRLQRLARAGHLPEADLSRARATADQRRAAADALRLEVKRVGRAGDVDVGDRRSRAEGLRRERARVAGELAVAHAAIARLEHEISRHRVTSPVAGRLASVLNLRPGVTVREGDRVAAVLPSGELKVVAEFAPEQALGKIRPGQRARLRLDGFAWTEYGSIPAIVTVVAGEARYGRVRVELQPAPVSGSRIPLQHGLPGSLEVVVEEVAPATLVLRAVGEATSGT